MRDWIRDHPLAFAVIGAALAIAGTTVLDAVGFGINVLPLVPVFFACWYLQRFTRVEVGLVWGRAGDYGLAVLYPVLVLGLIALIAWLSGGATISAPNWGSALANFAMQLISTAIFGMVTEEGVFRGWLWAALQRAGVARFGVLLWTSVAFGLWHLSTALLPTPFHPALVQVPIYIANAIAIGFTWGLIRERSGSIVVSSMSHAFWNAFVYTLFGYGTTIGVFGVHNTLVFGPEIGLLGLGANLIFATALWFLLRPPARPAPQAAAGGSGPAKSAEQIAVAQAPRPGP